VLSIARIVDQIVSTHMCDYALAVTCPSHGDVHSERTCRNAESGPMEPTAARMM
jgi:hypothetical protein